MLGNPFQQDLPTFRAVVSDEDVGEQDDGEGLGGITQPVNRLINKSTQNTQFIAAQKTHHGESDQARQIRKHILDRLETFLIGIVLELSRLFGELVAQRTIIKGLHALEEGIEFQFLLVEPKFFSRLLFQLRLGVAQEREFGGKLIDRRREQIGTSNLLNKKRNQNEQKQNPQGNQRAVPPAPICLLYTSPSPRD